MNRLGFLKSAFLLPFMKMNLADFENEIAGNFSGEERMPVLFVGHGNPMNAILDNEYTRKWKEIGSNLPLPKAILCVSAHWQTRGAQITYMNHPKTIHDFSGFPKNLYEVEYPAPGSPVLADKTIEALKPVHIEKNLDWGLDHGSWSVLKPMFPLAQIPTFQLSLDYLATPEQHFQMGLKLRSLRNKGILIVGSGNIVHNLGMLDWENKPKDWALEFDLLVKQKIMDGNFTSLVGYKELGKAAKLSIPTNEHYLPLLYSLALKNEKDEVHFFNETIDLGSISMRSLLIG